MQDYKEIDRIRKDLVAVRSLAKHLLELPHADWNDWEIDFLQHMVRRKGPLSHFRLAERHPALAHAVMAPLICWSFSNSMFRYFLVDHAVPAMWRSLAAARLSAD